MLLRLHDYWRSSAAYRVRIALNLKGVAYTSVPVDLAAGAQGEEANRAVNAQGLADMRLVPQMDDARRFEVAIEAYPRHVATCVLLAFAVAHPEVVRG